MLTLVNSQLHGTLHSTGTAFYTAVLNNSYAVPLNKLEVEIHLYAEIWLCRIAQYAISASDITVTYPNPDDTVPPGEEVLISATITTDNAPVRCKAGPHIDFPMTYMPWLKVVFQFVGGPPAERYKMSPFTIAQ